MQSSTMFLIASVYEYRRRDLTRISRTTIQVRVSIQAVVRGSLRTVQ
jgi:hypothetical protein